MQATVQILLATYNGERFLRAQLDSLFTQSFQEFTLLARDDGSTDNTLQIIDEYIEKYPSKISLIKDDKKNVGATQNFGILLENATADYIFFCDQDDVWINTKIENSLQKIQILEQTDKQKPCLVFSDMKWIDEQGNTINESLWKQYKLHPNYFTLNRLLIQNIPHGCTMLINKSLRDLAFPIPKEAILHDHWIALLAAAAGKWDAIQTPTVLLRFHAQNATQFNHTLMDKLKRFTTNFLSKEQYEYFIKIRVNQAKALKERTANNISEQQSDLIDKFILLEKTNGFRRKKLLLRYKFYRTTFWHTFKMIARA